MSRLEKVCCILAGLSLLIGVLMLSVFTAVRFTGFLLCCGSAALVIFVLLTRWRERRPWALWCRRIFLGLLAAGFALFAVLEIRVLSWARTDRETPVTAVIVLGAGVNGTEPSLSLWTRLDAALSYVKDRPDIPIVVTGSQGRGEDISEARCMADWLTARGVPQERIILEEQATNTEENIRYSLELLEQRTIAGNIAVVSSDYHRCRAAAYLGGNMVPVAARMPARYWPLTVNYYIREAFGLAAMVLQ